MLPLQTFSEIVKNTPLISIDLIITNPKSEVLVGLRVNRPAQNFWFVPGGRIYKDESIEIAFNRIIRTELPIVISFSDAKLRGVFQHIYKDNFEGINGYGTHYVVLAHEIKLRDAIALLPGDGQHRQYQWMPIDILLANPDVHPFTKFYFNAKTINQDSVVFPPCSLDA